MAEQSALEGFKAAAARVGVTGAMRVAPLGTKPKTDLKSKYDTDTYRNLGYLSPDGVTINFDESTQEYIPWQEMTAIRRDITQSVKTVQVTLWQFTKENAAMYFGVPGGQIVVNEEDDTWYFDEGGVPEFEHQQVILDVIDNNKAMRLTMYDAQVTERSGLTIKRDEMIGLQITLSGYPAGPEYASAGEDGKSLEGKTNRWLFSNSWSADGPGDDVNGGDDGDSPSEGQTLASNLTVPSKELTPSE